MHALYRIYILKKSLFIVIEGLDGSGKTTAGKRLAESQHPLLRDRVKFTYEPNDPSAGGEFIRQILRKEITRFHPRVLAYAFAANRLDHNYRLINPWLEKNGNILLSDRYYLSSLVYQSSEDFPMERVMELNELARRPDLIFFVNVTNETCYTRLAKRDQPRELFEGNLTQTRTKFMQAINFLRLTRRENIVEIDGNGTVEETVRQMQEAIIALSKSA